MLKNLFATSLLGMLCCTSLVISSDHSNHTESNWDEVSADVTARSKRPLGKWCCRPSLPKNAADGVKLNYCDSPESSIYQREYRFLRTFVPTLSTLTHNATTDQTSYQLLLDEANAIVAAYNAKFGITSGRLVVVDGDGLVLVDTGKGANNTLANALAGANPSTFASAINVNHNSRIAILDAQQYFAGVGLETKFSNSVGTDQIYVGIRLGPILHNDGTARISQNAP